MILGLDLGPSKSAWAQMDAATGTYQEGRVAMDNAAWLRLPERCRPEQPVIESGPLAARVHDLATERGLGIVAKLNGTDSPTACPRARFKPE